MARAKLGLALALGLAVASAHADFMLATLKEEDHIIVHARQGSGSHHGCCLR